MGATSGEHVNVRGATVENLTDGERSIAQITAVVVEQHDEWGVSERC